MRGRKWEGDWDGDFRDDRCRDGIIIMMDLVLLLYLMAIFAYYNG